MPWSVAVFASRESGAVLAACIDAVLAATKGVPTVIDVLVNGNDALAEQVAVGPTDAMESLADNRLRIWQLGVADKANAWNVYLHRIWRDSSTALFVDGYIAVKSNALEQLHEALANNQHALCASGVPTKGRSSRRLRREMLDRGGIHGNLYALRGSAMQTLRRTGFRLPVGLYRTDPLLGAVVAFGLDPVSNRWDSARMCVEPDATWDYRPLDWYRLSDVATHFKRMLRQGQGALENAAVRRWLDLDRKPAEELPRTVQELVSCWLRAFPAEARAVYVRRPLSYLAARRLSAETGLRAGEGAIRLVREFGTQCARLVEGVAV